MMRNASCFVISFLANSKLRFFKDASRLTSLFVRESF